MAKICFHTYICAIHAVQKYLLLKILAKQGLNILYFVFIPIVTLDNLVLQYIISQHMSYTCLDNLNF